MWEKAQIICFKEYLFVCWVRVSWTTEFV